MRIKRPIQIKFSILVQQKPQPMKTTKQHMLLKQVLLLVLILSFSTVIFAQDDNTTTDDTKQQKKEKKAKSSFKVFAGVNINDLSLDAADGVSSTAEAGYNLGFSYKRGRFFYYEIGARYNKRSFVVTGADEDTQLKASLSVSAIDIPLTAGLNITSFADRLIGLRVFVSAIPSITIGKDVDEVGLENDDITNFLFYGQGGVGIDIAFFFVEVGYNVGFSNLVNDMDGGSVTSKPSQGFVNVGFRF